MRSTSRRQRVLDSVMLNGIVTLIVIGVAVYLSYTANNGLPFKPTYRVSADVPSAGQLVRHADVRIGGARVGQVLSIEAIPARGNEPARARLHLALNESVGKLPADSRSEVRLASILGGKYLALEPGRSKRTVPEGGVLPVARAQATVDMDQAFRVLDPPTRRALAKGITELGTGLAGRGVALNRTLGNLSAAAGRFSAYSRTWPRHRPVSARSSSAPPLRAGPSNRSLRNSRGWWIAERQRSQRSTPPATRSAVRLPRCRQPRPRLPRR